MNWTTNVLRSTFSCAVVVALSFTLAVSAKADLLGLYTFENGIGDDSGNGNDPVAFNNLDLVAGIDGTAASFNGTDSYIDVPIDINPGPAPELTMGAWVRSNVDAGTHGILSHDNGGWDRSIGVNNGPHVAFNGSNTPEPHVNLTTDVEFVAVVYDGSSIRHYINESVQYTGDRTGDTDVGTADLRIGGLPGNPNWDWDGLIDNVFVFDDALTKGEINHIRTNGLEGIVNLPSIPDPILTVLDVWDFETDDLSRWSIVDTLHGDNAVFTTPGNMPTTLPATGFDDSTVQGDHFIRTWDGDVLGNTDAPTGIIESEEFVLAPDAQFDLLVGGGAHGFSGDPDDPLVNITAINLERRVADGDWEVIFTESGPNDNFLSPRVWDASAYAGETVRLRIYDTHSGGWGHIDVDNIMYAVPETSVPGDFNDDGSLGVDDIDALVGEIVAGTQDASFDLTNDGVLNGADIDEWLSLAGPSNGFAGPLSPGDANLDGIVDAQDLNALGLSWQRNVATWSGGDFSANGFVGADDLNVIGVNWQNSVPVAASAKLVPEPSSLLLVLAALVFAACIWRKR